MGLVRLDSSSSPASFLKLTQTLEAVELQPCLAVPLVSPLAAPRLGVFFQRQAAPCWCFKGGWWGTYWCTK